MDPATATVLGRIEDKLDDVNDKVERYGQQLARHDVRIEHVEDHVKGLQGDRTHDQRQGVSVRAALIVGLCTVLTSTGGSALVNHLTR